MMAKYLSGDVAAQLHFLYLDSLEGLLCPISEQILGPIGKKPIVGLDRSQPNLKIKNIKIGLAK